MKRLILVLALSGCSVLTQSDKSFLADAVAERIYQEARYEKVCVQAQGPATCSAFQSALQELKTSNELALQVISVGALPPQQKAEIKKLLKRIESLP